ncbi:putative ADP-ribosylation factor-like protein 5C isoform X2 [Rattus norvegicus]|uniref:putative ADP-ribosylation factor-like protein 5C isoform X2 n=1 Tax=Rattus norvegicus TaxID=10116 RepID=UPI0019176E25|nr:putative ADP-ribosylation factor-like protein 5C isoform X2 [Rattus norvegicus]
MRRLLGTPKPVLIRVGSDLTVPLDASRAQSHHRGTGQCRKDHHSLPVLLKFQCGPQNSLALQTTRPQNHKLHLDKTPSLTNEVVHTCSTIGSNVEEIVFQRTHFLMWDLGGQEALRSTWETYYSNAEALQDASVLIFANKQDVKDSMTTAEISQFLTLSAIKDHPWHIQGCCALTGEGLLAGLQWMHSQATTN